MYQQSDKFASCLVRRDCHVDVETFLGRVRHNFGTCGLEFLACDSVDRFGLPSALYPPYCNGFLVEVLSAELGGFGSSP